MAEWDQHVSCPAYLADMNGQKKGGCGHFMAEWDQHVSCPAYLADMNGQRKGGCGHFMAEWDQHVSCPAYLADMNGQRKGGCGHFMAEWDQHVSCPAYLADMNGQRKGGCGHFMAEWDQHVSCPACRDCVFPDRPCPVCLAFTQEQRDLASYASSGICYRRLRSSRFGVAHGFCSRSSGVVGIMWGFPWYERGLRHAVMHMEIP